MWYVANCTIGKSSSSAVVAEPNYSSAAYQWQSRHYHCPHQTVRASPLQKKQQKSTNVMMVDYPPKLQTMVLFTNTISRTVLSTHYDSSKLSMECKDILADNVCQLPVSRTTPDRRGLDSRLRYKSELMCWLDKSVQVQEAGEKYELMVIQITKDNEHRLIRKCPSS